MLFIKICRLKRFRDAVFEHILLHEHLQNMVRTHVLTTYESLIIYKYIYIYITIYICQFNSSPRKETGMHIIKLLEIFNKRTCNYKQFYLKFSLASKTLILISDKTLNS